MSLFNNLLQLNPNQIPLEDFFTEIFAYLLKMDSNLLCEWLKEFKISSIQPESQQISTQESFDALDEHFSGSRPDIYIEIANKFSKELILVECKIGSTEGPDQLQRYAEHMDKIKSISSGVLIYITRDYDKKDLKLIFANCKKQNKLKFKQLRWYENYLFLVKYNENLNNSITSDALKFMEENGLSGSNRFTSIDVLAITNFPRVQKMMEESMSGEVMNKFEMIAGGGKPRHSSALNDLRLFNRYVYSQFQEDKFEILLGYWMDGLKVGDYPKIGLSINVSPKAVERAEILKSMREIDASSDKWWSYNLNETKNWAGIGQTVCLDHFIHQEDHIQAIQNYFLELFDELVEIKRKYHHLKWIVTEE